MDLEWTYKLCKLGYKLTYKLDKLGYKLVKLVDFKGYLQVTYAIYKLVISYLTFLCFELRVYLGWT